MVSRQIIAQCLTDTGHTVAELTAADGSRILFLASGARVLGLYAPGDERNFLWTHPALGSVDGARQLYSGGKWPNPGGDRTWLAPEHALFFSGKQPEWKHYRVPTVLDPGRFKLARFSGHVRLTGRVRLPHYGTRKPIATRLSKTITLAPSPLRDEASLCGQAGYAGYTVQTTLATDSPTPLGLWQLLQLPPGGDMFISTYGKAAPHVLFGSIYRRDWIATHGLLLHPMKSPGSHKLGLRAAGCTGRAGYLYRMEERDWSLVVRHWTVDPSGLYVDTRWQNPGGPGDCFQLCNVDAPFGRFSELEYHAPAAGFGSVAVDRSHVWAFRGSLPVMRKIGRFLLGGSFL